MAQGVSMQALERAVRLINSIISRTQNSPAKDNGAPGRAKGKWVKLAAQGKGKVSVQQHPLEAKGLAAYLALPVEQYSLLDPTWIEREPGDSNTFCLRAPLQGTIGVDLQPRIWVSVSPDPIDRSVTFTSERASLGDPRLDERFALSLASTLSVEGQRGSTALPRSRDADTAHGEGQAEGSLELQESRATAEAAHRNGADQAVQVEQRAAADRGHLYASTGHDRNAAPMTASAGATASTSSAGEPEQARGARMRAQSAASMAAFGRPPPQEQGRKPLTGPPSQLHARVHVRMDVRLTAPLTAVPGFLLSTAGGLVATALLQAVIPVLLDLLARDYEQWANGSGRTGKAREEVSQVNAPAMLSLEM